MASWISTVKTLAHTLADIDAKPTDEDIIIVLTNGLPSAYNTLIATLDSVASKDLTVDYVITRLANEKVRLDGVRIKEEDELSIKTEEAELALLSLKGKARDLKDVECYGCGEFGHYRSECPELKKRHKAEVAAMAQSGLVNRDFSF